MSMRRQAQLRRCRASRYRIRAVLSLRPIGAEAVGDRDRKQMPATSSQWSLPDWAREESCSARDAEPDALSCSSRSPQGAAHRPSSRRSHAKVHSQLAKSLARARLFARLPSLHSNPLLENRRTGRPSGLYPSRERTGGSVHRDWLHMFRSAGLSDEYRWRNPNLVLEADRVLSSDLARPEFAAAYENPAAKRRGEVWPLMAEQ